MGLVRFFSLRAVWSESTLFADMCLFQYWNCLFVYHFQVLAVLVVNSVKVSSGQTDPCIAPPPCTCSGSLVSCSHQGLLEIPNFNVTDQQFSFLNIKLDGNNISDVRAFAFANLSKTNCSSISIDLSENELSKIDLEAFEGIENNITELDLSRNELKVLPRVLMSLKNLKTLSIFSNNIKEFDTNITQRLGLSLSTFRVGTIENEPWPSSFRYLFKLNKLTLQGVNSVSLPFDAFIGFESMLTSLQIEYSKLYMVPTALCSLRKLLALSFTYNDNLVDRAHIFPMCCPALTSLRTLIISYDRLIRFPPIFSTFPNLTTLRITNNPELTYIDESLTTNSSQLSYLDISSNGFTQIPEVLQRLKSLQRLDISNNSITSLEDYNLKDMISLKRLSLNLNPLSYIAETAFRNLSSLESLELEFVKLKIFPRAVLELTKLTFINLRYGIKV